MILIVCGVFAKNNYEAIESSLKNYAKYLSSEELEGRGTGLEGNRKAAEFIKNQFEAFGLKPIKDSYYQDFLTVTETRIAGRNEVTISFSSPESESTSSSLSQSKISWTIGEDYIPLSFSNNGTTQTKLVFAGYGISSQENNYDDYDNIDVAGKAVIVLRGNPDGDNPHSKFESLSSLRYKATNAREHKAEAIIFTNTEVSEEEELINLTANRMGSESGIISLHADRKSVDKLFGDDNSLSNIIADINSSKKPNSFKLNNVEMELALSLEHVKKTTSNVIGFIPGTDASLSDEYIIVGAHYDHLGYGGENSRYSGNGPIIHHGADDNASGTSAMLTLSEEFSKNPAERPIIFMGFTGEEYGLLGSSYYCKNPLVPLEETIFMLNLDMIGRMDENKLNVHGSGTSARWDSLLDSLGTVYNFDISTSSSGWGPSDHSSFYAQNIPVLFLFTGLHDDYHRPTDTWEKLNYQRLAQIVAFSESLVRTVAISPEKPDFVKTSSPGPTRAMGFKVYVGTIPDYSDNPKGMRLTGVREGSPAAKGGMRGGDILVQFGELEIKNIYDYTYALAKYKPGDVVDVVVLRGQNDEKVTLQVAMEKRN
jgi:hypothetical protein